MHIDDYMTFTLCLTSIDLYSKPDNWKLPRIASITLQEVTEQKVKYIEIFKCRGCWLQIVPNYSAKEVACNVWTKIDDNLISTHFTIPKNKITQDTNLIALFVYKYVQWVRSRNKPPVGVSEYFLTECEEYLERLSKQ